MPKRPTFSKPRPRVARHAAAERVAPIRIVVADSQAIDRGGLVGMLEDERDFEVVGEAATLEECIQQCRALRPGVLLLSLNLPGQEEQPAIPAIHTVLPQQRIVALSERGFVNCLVLNPPSRRRTPVEARLACATGSDCLRLAAVQGAMATVRRSADPEDLFRAIRAVASGHAWLDPSTVDGLVAGSNGGARPGRGVLSPREMDVAALLAEGQSNKEISSSLGISEPTVKKHIGRILEQLGVADRLQAGLVIARNPLVLKR